jgi:hypothetical protein
LRAHRDTTAREHGCELGYLTPVTGGENDFQRHGRTGLGFRRGACFPEHLLLQH